jgi:hypothetical protein
MNPRSLKIYDEAGALQTDIAQLATAGSSYSIYAFDVNGDMMKPTSAPEMPVRAADNSDFREGGASQIVYNGKYYRETDGTFYLNGIPVTDEKLIKELQYNQRIANGELESVETNGEWDSYLTGTKDNPQGIKVNKNTKKVKEMTAQEALDLIEKIEKEKARKEREQAAKTEKQRFDAQDGEVVGYEPMDGEFDFDDSLPIEINRYILTSDQSFSCGNLVPTALKGKPCVTLLGKTSGGGSCVVRSCTSASGAVFAISSSNQISSMKNGSLYNADEGAEPDFAISRYETFYDREALVDFIHNLP